MLRLRRLAILVPVVAVIGAMPAPGQSVDIPLSNWTVPAYHRSSSGGLSTMTDVTPGVAFVGLAPCRVVDTRPSQGFGGAYGPPIMAANAIRTFDINSGPCTGIPAGVDAYSLNFAVTETTGAPGDIRAFPTGTGVSTTSVLNWNFVGNGAIANAIIIPAGTGGSIDVLVAGFDTHLVIDINGYFTDTYNTGVQFLAIGSIGGNGMIAGINSAAVNDSAGVSGTTTGLARTFGVLGVTSSNPNGSAGVKGVQGAAVAGTNSQAPAGVVGTSPLFDGVLGITQGGSGGAAVRGARINVVPETSGELGAAGLGGKFTGDVEITGDLDVLSGFSNHPGNITKDGTVSFIEPHPTDASKAIRYVSLEGPEAGTYFRGRGKFQNGLARIPVPDNFRFVTAEEGLTVQATPIGAMATVGVLKMDLNEIVIRSSRDVEFSYLVQGVRRSFADYQPIVDAGVRYVRSATSRLEPSQPPERLQRLIANGTYNTDGTVNMETARRLGWDRIWEARQHDEPASMQPNP